jgi:ribonuclease D
MRLITTTQELGDLCQRLSEHEFVAVDTEFIREQTFWPRLCVIQLAGPREEAIVDPLTPGIALDPFYELMANEGVVKVFHAARQDLEIVWTQARLIPHPIFDTQIAAMVCGFGESVSYVSLVKQTVGHNLDKTSRFTDWARRPLSEKQLAYALADVTHLREVYLRLKSELEATGRVRWLDEEMAELTNPEMYEARPEDAWRRLKLRVRGRKGLAVLIELAAWRERLAQRLDVPRNRILRDEALYDVASNAPTDIAQLAQLRSLSEGFARSGRAKEIIDAVNRGLKRDPKTLPTVREGSGLPAEKAATVELVRVLLKACAARSRVAPRLIADADHLERLAVEEAPDIPALKGWRHELFGSEAERLKRGEVALKVEGGEVISVPVAPTSKRGGAR